MGNGIRASQHWLDLCTGFVLHKSFCGQEKTIGAEKKKGMKGDAPSVEGNAVRVL